MPLEHKLDYKNPAQFMKEVNPEALRPGNRVALRLEGGTDYVFTYLNTINGDIHGRSALTGGQVSVNVVDMVLTEG